MPNTFGKEMDLGLLSNAELVSMHISTTCTESRRETLSFSTTMHRTFIGMLIVANRYACLCLIKFALLALWKAVHLRSKASRNLASCRCGVQQSR
jgi:hypothetical protein